MDRVNEVLSQHPLQNDQLCIPSQAHPYLFAVIHLEDLLGVANHVVIVFILKECIGVQFVDITIVAKNLVLVSVVLRILKRDLSSLCDCLVHCVHRVVDELVADFHPIGSVEVVIQFIPLVFVSQSRKFLA